MKLNETTYGMKLTIAAALRIEKICPDGRIDRISELIKTDPITAIVNVSRIAAALNEGHADSEAYAGREANRIHTGELVSACADELFFSNLVAEITEVFNREYSGTIETRPTKKGREAQKREKHKTRTIEGSLPWYMYFGRRHGMNREDVLNTVFGEFQDLMTCEAIYMGFAEEVERKRQLTQEEMYMLE